MTPDFDAITDPAKKREAQLFTNAVLLGTNLSAAILHALVIKGVFTKEVAVALIDDAFDKAQSMSFPPGYQSVPDTLATALKSGFK